ncbi:hypothetical protein [Streptomyces sp. NPDC058371]|uniref:hypothetical protein n=1 Tax=Streptomyces sp. NPDC058371 TaxID=3346463 RepID=UPI0036579D08
MKPIAQGLQRKTSVALLATLLLTSCADTYSDESMPEALCGTPISKKLTARLLQPFGRVTEWTSAGFREAGTSSWCVVYVAKKDALHVQFASHGGPMNPMEAASPDNSVTGLQNPHPLHLADDAVAGDDGAIATTRCKDKSGADHFTLALRVTRGKVTAERSAAIERFMRSYMPATVKTLHCLKE